MPHNALTTATVAKISLETGIHLGNSDYFAILSSCSRLEEEVGMKGLPLCVHVVIKTYNLQISRCFADYVKGLSLIKCVPHVQHDYFPSFNQSDQ